MTVGEHLASYHWTKNLQILLALVSIPDSVTLPQNITNMVAILPNNIVTSSRVLAQTLSKVWPGPSSDVITGVEVALGNSTFMMTSSWSGRHSATEKREHWAEVSGRRNSKMERINNFMIRISYIE